MKSNKRFLISGYLEAGVFHDTEKGTPQGGVISPELANIYLHYVLDLWLTTVVKKQMRGYVEIIRYADDFVICVQYKDEAETILRMLKERLGKFGLELAPDKTRIVEFGRYAEERARKRGGGKPGTFNFLGFTHYCTRSRKGTFKVGRSTDRRKLIGRVKELNLWLKDIRNAVKLETWWKMLKSKMLGHYRYFGVSENSRGIGNYRHLVKRLAFKWINRCSQRKSMNWLEFESYCQRHGFPQSKLYVNLYAAPLVNEGIGF